MAAESQYQGSQAFAQNIPSEESVSPNSGSVGFSKILIDLRGVTASIGLQLRLSYKPSVQGVFGLPKNWGLEIPFTIPGKSLTSQGKTFVVDRDWSDQAGWQSGLRYVNNHGMLFESVTPAQPLPSGRPGDYAWRLKAIDGSREYFDVYGKLLEHADVYGNSIYYAYVDFMAGPLTAKIDFILDSWAPDGGQANIVFGNQGVDSIQDAMGYTTLFTYVFLAGQTVIDSISFSSGLQSKFEYISLPAIDGNGNPFNIPACSRHIYRNSAGDTVSQTKYEYGQETGYANFTGATIGCRMQSSVDSLMDSQNQDFRYDVAIMRLDINGTTLQMSRVYYNYLHLSMQEDHYNIDASGNAVPSSRTMNVYDIPIDLHARSTTYSQPVQVNQLHYYQSNIRPLRRARSSYDAYGCPLSTTEWMWDKGQNDLVMQKSITSSYARTLWGGELLENESFVDHVSGHEKHMAFEFTSDERNIAKSTVTYRTDNASPWKPWKTKSCTYDNLGRATAETVTWSEAVDFPIDSVKQYAYRKAYLFDAGSGVNSEKTTDPLGNVSCKSYMMRTKGGPLVQQASPLGLRETLKYDLSGRPVEIMDALGSSTKISYSVGPGQNFVQNVTSSGYTTRATYDTMGRCVNIMDSGNSGSTIVSRILSQTEYDAASRAVKSVNELGQVTTQAYDALGRVIKSTEACGNVTTFEYDDSELSMGARVNGDLRTKIFSDALGRQTKTVTYGDSGASNNSYRLISEQVYDGFGKVTSSKSFQQLTHDSTSILLSQKDVSYDVEDKPYKIMSSALPSNLSGSMDKVVREIQFDIFGNAVTYKKTVSYADGRQFVHDGPVSIFDGGGRLVQLRNQLGQTEINEFDADGRLVNMTRYDGTKQSYAYDQIGQLLLSTSPDGSTAHEYLPNGRLASVTKAAATIKHSYALDGSIKSTQYPDGQMQTYVLDEFSRVIREVNAAGLTTINTFDAYGRVASKELKDSKIVYQFGTVNHTLGQLVGSSVSGSQSLHRSIVYDAFGRQIQTKDQDPDGKVILNALYLYDSRSRLVTYEVSSEKYPEAPGVNKKEQFEYDGLGQLISHSRQYDRNLAPPQTKKFKFDGNFNVILKITNNTSESLSYNSLDQRKDPGFVYDTNGRLLHDAGGRSYSYDSEDRLLSVTGSIATAYTYNPDSSLATMLKGATTVKDAESSTLYYSCGAVNASRDQVGSQSTWTSYLLQPKGRVAAEVEGRGDSIFLESRNSVAMTLKDGTSTTHDYQAYGEETVSDDKFQFGWQQELRDIDDGLTYLRSRYYQASNMAFITMDSYRSQENRYAFCNGDPVNALDGTGHDADPAVLGAVAGAIVGLAVGVASGGALTLLGASITGASLSTIGVGAATVSGALASIAGDATSAAIQHQSFTAARAGEDLLVGAVGGAVGAGSGGLASSAAMRMALSSNLSRVAITRIGTATACVVGGGSGGFAGAGTSALLHHEPLFSTTTAFAALLGAASGAAGSFIAGGASLARRKLAIIPVELTEAERHLIVPGVVPQGRIIEPPKIFAMSTTREMENDLNGASLRLLQTGADGKNHFTIIAHGDAGRMYATVKYQGEEVYRPINPTLLAMLLAGTRTS